MPRFEKKVIEQYGRRIAKALRVIIKCDEFGKLWNKDNKDCQACKIDSSEYYTKCKEFTKGVGAGYRPKSTTKKRKPKKEKKPQVIVYKPKKRMLQPFRRHTRSDVIYRYLKDNPYSNIRIIAKYLSEYFERDISLRALRDVICVMRKELRKVDHEVIKCLRGFYFIEKTPKGRKYGNTKEAIEFRARELEKEKQEKEKKNDNEVTEHNKK